MNDAFYDCGDVFCISKIDSKIHANNDAQLCQSFKTVLEIIDNYNFLVTGEKEKDLYYPECIEIEEP